MIEEYNSATLESHFKFEGPFRMWSEYDLMNLIFLKNNLHQGPVLDYDTITSLFEGHSVFSILFENERVLRYIKDNLLQLW